MKTMIPSEFICRKCKILKLSSEFLPDRLICKECSKPDPDVKRNSNLRRRYGISLEEYNQMFLDQHGVCACCGQVETEFDIRLNSPARLRVDHDHATGKVRGLLCNACNTAVGLMEEDPHKVLSLMSYILKFKLS